VLVDAPDISTLRFLNWVASMAGKTTSSAHRSLMPRARRDGGISPIAGDGRGPAWLKMKNPDAPAVTEED
jgi:hypothetical protein